MHCYWKTSTIVAYMYIHSPCVHTLRNWETELRVMDTQHPVETINCFKILHIIQLLLLVCTHVCKYMSHACRDKKDFGTQDFNLLYMYM